MSASIAPLGGDEKKSILDESFFAIQFPWYLEHKHRRLAVSCSESMFVRHTIRSRFKSPTAKTTSLVSIMLSDGFLFASDSISQFFRWIEEFLCSLEISSTIEIPCGNLK